MKKILLTLAIVLCYVATAVAESVSPAAARAAAAQFLLTQGAVITDEEVATPRGGRAAASDRRLPTMCSMPTTRRVLLW